jgi:trigger factor
MATEETTTIDTPDALDAPAAAVPEKLQQAVEITDVGPCKKHVKVTVDRAAINTRFAEKFDQLMVENPAHIPGFRPGKAPKKIVQKKFSKEVTAEVRQEVLMASLEQLADEAKLSPLSPPDLDPAKVLIPEDDTLPLVYEFDIEVRPEFDLPDYKGLKLRRPTYEFTEADVAKEKRRILEPMGTIVPKEPDAGGKQVVALDDVIVANLTIKDGDAELNKVSEVQLKVEKRLALDDGIAEDFGKELVGATPGDTRTVTIVLRADLANEALRGKSVQAVFDIQDVKVIRQPELTPDLLERLGVNNAEQLDEAIRVRLERYLDYTQRQTARAQVLEKLAGAANWELPQDLLRRQARRTLQRKVLEMRSAGMTEEQIQSRERLLVQDALRSTAAALKETFVLQKIAEVEDVKIEDADLDAEIDAIAERTDETPRKVRARLERDDLMESLASELLERKALDLVLQAAEYEDYKFNPLADEEQQGMATVSAAAAPE